jgi:hypothetical protein
MHGARAVSGPILSRELMSRDRKQGKARGATRVRSARGDVPLISPKPVWIACSSLDNRGMKHEKRRLDTNPTQPRSVPAFSDSIENIGKLLTFCPRTFWGPIFGGQVDVRFASRLRERVQSPQFNPSFDWRDESNLFRPSLPALACSPLPGLLHVLKSIRKIFVFLLALRS